MDPYSDLGLDLDPDPRGEILESGFDKKALSRVQDPLPSLT